MSRFVGIQDGGRVNGNTAISQYTWYASSNLTKVMTQFCSHSSGEVTWVQKKYHDDEKIFHEATKPEVVITKCRYEIEMQFRPLHIGFRGRQGQRNIDRHQVLYCSE